MTITVKKSIVSELCSDIRRRVGDGRNVPLKYMRLVRGFRLQTDDTSERLVLFPEADPTTREEIGYQEYDPTLPGQRWYLYPEWRQDVTFLLSKLGMIETPEEEDLPY